MSGRILETQHAGENMEKKPELGTSKQLGYWLERHRNGDDSAKASIIAHSCERLRVLASKMLRGNFARLARWEHTDDVLQHALIRLHRSLADVQPETVGQLMGLSATQIRRTLLDLARHHFGPQGAANHHHSDGHRTDIPRQIDLKPTGDEPESLVDWVAFHEAVENLPTDEKQVFSLVWYEGLTHVETATVLGVTERTIRRRWHSARFLLHEVLGQPLE